MCLIVLLAVSQCKSRWRSCVLSMFIDSKLTAYVQLCMGMYVQFVNTGVIDYVCVGE